MKLKAPFLFGTSTNSTIFPDYFTMAVMCHKSNTHITMQFLTKEVTTRNMSSVKRLLQMYLPTILESSCFNEENLPFHEEVSHTELGHLFEHILLEYLCKEKISAGDNEAVFRGVTKWNWNKDRVGTFHINVDVSGSEKDLLYFALEQSILLLKRIMYHHKVLPSYADTMKPSFFLPSLATEKQMV